MLSIYMYVCEVPILTTSSHTRSVAGRLLEVAINDTRQSRTRKVHHLNNTRDDFWPTIAFDIGDNT